MNNMVIKPKLNLSCKKFINVIGRLTSRGIVMGKTSVIILLLVFAVVAAPIIYHFYLQYTESRESESMTHPSNQGEGENPQGSPLLSESSEISTPGSLEVSSRIDHVPHLHVPSFTPPNPPEEYRVITITDNAGRNVTVTVPVQRIVSLNSGLTEMLCVLGAQGKIIGRDATSTMPPSILSVPVVGENSYQPNVEAILELKPDIIFADSMLAYNTVAMQQLEGAGIPIFISDPTDPKPTPRSNTTVVDFTCNLLMKMAMIVGGEMRASEYIQLAQYYNNLVKQRIASLPNEKRPKVMWEWYAPYWTFISPAIYHAGGINIAENMTVYAPVMSPEFVVEQNPQVIIRMISSPTHDLNDFVKIWQEIMSRPELQNVDAIKKGRVYICDWKLRDGILAVVGYLYFAKWIQPTLFEDVDPAKVMAEIYQRFFGITVEGTFVYPP